MNEIESHIPITLSICTIYLVYCLVPESFKDISVILSINCLLLSLLLFLSISRSGDDRVEMITSSSLGGGERGELGAEPLSNIES